MRTVTKSIWAATCAIGLCLASGPVAAQFNQFYFFGDSLTDAGSFKPVLPPGTGKFTTNPGPIWAEVLAQRYGSTATPANQGGNDYAEGGARVTQLPGFPASPPTGNATPVAAQVQQFLAKGAAGTPVNPAVKSVARAVTTAALAWVAAVVPSCPRCTVHVVVPAPAVTRTTSLSIRA